MQEEFYQIVLKLLPFQSPLSLIGGEERPEDKGEDLRKIILRGEQDRFNQSKILMNFLKFRYF